MTAIDGVRCEGNGFTDAVGVSGRDKRGGGVEDDHISARGAFALEHGADYSGILRGIASND
jgi:hypothetical protein